MSDFNIRKPLRTYTDAELMERYDNPDGYQYVGMELIPVEMQRRENEKTNKIMRKWTIAIGIMTGAMLLITIANIIIAIINRTPVQ